MRIIAALQGMVRCKALILDEDRVVIPYHFDARGTRNVELHWSDGAWWISHDGTTLCRDVTITGAEGDFHSIQRDCYEVEAVRDER